MKHRFFVTLHTLENPKTNKYSKEQKEYDFPDDVNVEAATAEIYAKFGQLGRDDRPSNNGVSLAPMRYAVIHSHQLVSPHEKGTMFPSQNYVEQALPGIDYKACLKDSPKLAKRKIGRKGME